LIANHRDKGDTMTVTTQARVAAAMRLLGEAENKVHAAQRILAYEEQQEDRQEDEYTMGATPQTETEEGPECLE
jgi:hypothetical protein